MKTYPLLSTLLLGLIPISAAYSQDAFATHRLQSIDTNNDSTMSKDEVIGARAHYFTRLDRNGDGYIDRDEIDAARDAVMDRAEAIQSRLGTAWRRMDRDGSGTVSEDEFRDRTVLFSLVDRDGDGKLTPAEVGFVRNLIADRH
jgi:hypothetical protein